MPDLGSNSEATDIGILSIDSLTPPLAATVSSVIAVARSDDECDDREVIIKYANTCNRGTSSGGGSSRTMTASACSSTTSTV